MPLVIMCGYPAAGKTTLAIQLAAFLTAHTSLAVQVVNDESLAIPTNAHFSHPTEEKKCRAALLAASERLINKDTIVIVDALNYIKGFRYQLYCQARAAGTPHLLLHCEAREDTCRQWNVQRPDQRRIYPAAQLEDLLLRFEPPNSHTKWDSPLFSIITEGASPSHQAALFSSLLPVLTAAPVRPPSASTRTSAPSSALSELDRQTQAVVDCILAHQHTQLSLVRFPETNKTLTLLRPVNVTQLARLRRQFLHMNRLHPVVDPDAIRNLFIDYLGSNLFI